MHKLDEEEQRETKTTQKKKDIQASAVNVMKGERKRGRPLGGGIPV